MSSSGSLATMARGGALNLIGAAVTGVSGFALVAIVAAVYPSPVAGAFFAATSVFLIIGAICELGSDVGLVRWVPHHLALERSTDAARCVLLAVIPVTAVSIVAASVMFSAAPWITEMIAADDAAQTVAMLRILAVFLPVAAVFNAVQAATRGHGVMRPTVLFDRIARPLIQIIAVWFAGAVNDDPWLLGLAWGVPYLPALGGTLYWYTRLRRSSRPQVEPPLSIRALAGEYWRFTALRAVARVCQTALQRADIVLVAALSSPRDAAIYTAATRFVVLGQLGSQAVQQVMQPVVSRQLALSDRPGAEQTFTVATTWTVLLTWPIYLSAVFAAPIYLALFSEEYLTSGEGTVIILSLAMLLASAAGPVDTMLLMHGRSGLSLANTVVALVVDLGLGVLLIPEHGVSGAAVAWAVSIVVRNVLSFGQVRMLSGMSPLSPGLAWAVVVGVTCFALPLAAARPLIGNPVALGALLVPCAGVYVSLLWKIRGRVALTALSALLPRPRSRTGAVPAVKEV